MWTLKNASLASTIGCDFMLDDEKFRIKYDDDANDEELSELHEKIKSEISPFFYGLSKQDEAKRLQSLLDISDVLLMYTNHELGHSMSMLKPDFSEFIRLFYQTWKRHCVAYLSNVSNDITESLKEEDGVPQRSHISEPWLFEAAKSEKLLDTIRTETNKRRATLRNAKKQYESKEKSPSTQIQKDKYVRSITVIECSSNNEETRYYANNDPCLSFPLKFRKVEMMRQTGGPYLLYHLAAKTENSQRKVFASLYRKNAMDYWNSEKDNPLYKHGNYKLSKIIQYWDGYYMPAISLKLIKPATFEKQKRRAGCS
jgi:hypothetical protein